MNSVKIDLNCPYQQTYHFILTHKLSPCLECFGDISNKLFISEFGSVEGTVPYESTYDSRVFGELGPWLWISRQIRDTDFACLHHYRRKLYGCNGITLPQPLTFPGRLIDQLAFYHSPKLAEAFMKVCTPLEQQMMCGNTLFAWNIFCAPGYVIKDWCKYTEMKINALVEILGCGRTKDDVSNYVSQDGTYCTPVEGKNTDVTYQTRILGCALERFNTLYWLQSQLPKTFREVKLLELGQKI